jgi:segregation and condensation protein A
MTTQTSGYSVDLEVFQGPLDLLLYLIRKDEIDIYDIPISRITQQYLAYVEMLKLLNLENAGEYILMAATLIRIKAHMLLPRDPDNEEEMDPREELTLALLEYRKFKEAGEILGEKRDFESRLVSVAGRTNGYRGRKAVLVEDTSLFDLLSAFHEVMSRFEEDSQYTVDHEDMTVEDRIEVIQQFLQQNEFATFEQLFADIRIKIVAILTFLAILEMVRTHLIVVRQSLSFSEIRIYRIGCAPVEEKSAPPQPEMENTPVLAKAAAES